MEYDIVNLIGSLGFPIAVTAYLLIERGKSIKALTEAVHELRVVVEKIHFKQ